MELAIGRNASTDSTFSHGILVPLESQLLAGVDPMLALERYKRHAEQFAKLDPRKFLAVKVWGPLLAVGFASGLLNSKSDLHKIDPLLKVFACDCGEEPSESIPTRRYGSKGQLLPPTRKERAGMPKPPRYNGPPEEKPGLSDGERKIISKDEVRKGRYRQ